MTAVSVNHLRRDLPPAGDWPFHDGCGGVVKTLDHGNDMIGRFPIADICMSCGATWSKLELYRELCDGFGGSILAPFGSDEWAQWTRRRERGMVAGHPAHTTSDPCPVDPDLMIARRLLEYVGPRS